MMVQERVFRYDEQKAVVRFRVGALELYILPRAPSTLDTPLADCRLAIQFTMSVLRPPFNITTFWVTRHSLAVDGYRKSALPPLFTT